MASIQWDYLGDSRGELEAEFGPLSPYLVSNDESPVLLKREGAFHGLFVFNDEVAEREHLHRGFVLPFQWRKDVEHDPALDKTVHDTADTVCKRVDTWLDEGNFRSLDNETSAETWGVRLPEDLFDGFDWSALPIEGHSLAAPMTAGLLLAILRGEPKRHVFATGVAKGGGFEKVGDHIEYKVDAVRRLRDQLDETPILFVPESNADRAKEAAEEEVDIRRYPEGETEFNKLMRDHLRALEFPPRFEDPNAAQLETMARHANRPYWGTEYRTDYYLDHLLLPLAERFRGDLPDRLNIERLVLTLGRHHELPMMLLHAYRPSQVHIICSEDNYDQSLEKLIDDVERVGALDGMLDLDKSDARILRNGEGETLIEALTAWLRDVPRAERALDMTSGTAKMSAAATLVAERAPARLLYVNHDYRGGPKFNTEDPELLDWGLRYDDAI